MDAAVPFRHVLRFRSHPAGLRGELSGHIDSVEGMAACWLEIAAEIGRRQAAAMLVVDMLESEPLPLDQLEEFIGMTLGMGLMHVRIAYVDQRWGQDERLELANLRALEHGYDVRVFDDEEAAARWLQYGDR